MPGLFGEGLHAQVGSDAADALLARQVGVDQQLVQRHVQEAAGGVVAAHRVALGAEQTRQRQAGELDNNGTDYDENRIIVNYPLNLL